MELKKKANKWYEQIANTNSSLYKKELEITTKGMKK